MRHLVDQVYTNCHLRFPFLGVAVTRKGPCGPCPGFWILDPVQLGLLGRSRLLHQGLGVLEAQALGNHRSVGLLADLEHRLLHRGGLVDRHRLDGGVLLDAFRQQRAAGDRRRFGLHAGDVLLARLERSEHQRVTRHRGLLGVALAPALLVLRATQAFHQRGVGGLVVDEGRVVVRRRAGQGDAELAHQHRDAVLAEGGVGLLHVGPELAVDALGVLGGEQVLRVGTDALVHVAFLSVYCVIAVSLL